MSGRVGAPVAELDEVLRGQPYSAPLEVGGILALADECALDLGVVVVDGHLRHPPSEQAPSFDAADAVWRASGRTGFAHAHAVLEHLRATEDGRDLDPGGVRLALTGHPDVMELADGWFYSAPLDGIAVGATKRMLRVGPALPIPELHEGLRRAFGHRQLGPPPPLAVLRSFYAQHPDFAVSDRDIVTSAVELGPANDTVQTKLVAILRRRTPPAMSKDELLEETRAEGLSWASVQVYLQYGEQLKKIGPNVWAPIGADISPEAADEVRRRARLRRLPLEVDYEFCDDGTVRLTAHLNTPAIANGVLPIPAPYARALGGVRYVIRTAHGSTYGHAAVSGDSALYGFSSLFSRLRPDEGDTLIARLDRTRADCLVEYLGPE